MKRTPIVPEDLRELIGVSDPQMSPDGHAIAFVHAYTGDHNRPMREIWLADLEHDDVHAFTAGGKDRHPRWSPDGAAIAFIGERATEQPQIYVIPTDGGEAQVLTHFPEGTIAGFRWSPDGTMLAVKFREQDPEWTTDAVKARKAKELSDPPRVIDDWWYRLDGDGYFNAQRFALYIVDIETGEHRQIYAKDRLGFFDFDWKPDGTELVLSTNRHKRALVTAKHTELLRLDVKTGRITMMPDLPPGPKSAVAWSPDGRWIAYAGREGDDAEYSTENLELWVCDVRRGTARSLTADSDYCLLAPALSDTADVVFEARLRWSPRSDRIYVEVGWQGETHVAAVPRSGGDITMLTSGTRSLTMGTTSDDGTLMAMVSTETTAPPEIHIGRIGSGAITIDRVTSFNDAWLSMRHVRPIRSHWITTEDGTRVQVWVMLPANATRSSSRSFPAVLVIHGGPHAQYGVGFFHEFQTLAAAGYAVVFANPRGSKGYGRDHCAAIRGNWGSADWVDMQAVIDFMIDHPRINSKRMAVAGGSYGRYMTNWIIGHTSQFAAAITDRCVSNLLTLLGTSDFSEAPDTYFPGNTWSKTDKLWDQSPLRLAGNVKTPTLIIHSEGDLRCNVAQAEEFYTALCHNRVPTRFIRYPRTTSHGMSRSGPMDMRLHRLNSMLEWLRRYLKPAQRSRR